MHGKLVSFNKKAWPKPHAEKRTTPLPRRNFSTTHEDAKMESAFLPK